MTPCFSFHLSFLLDTSLAFSLLHLSLSSSAQRLAILSEKLEFLSRHPCVNHSQLEELVKVGPAVSYPATTNLLLLSYYYEPTQTNSLLCIVKNGFVTKNIFFLGTLLDSKVFDS